jgi:uncharacterized integral membrane protein
MTSLIIGFILGFIAGTFFTMWVFFGKIPRLKYFKKGR